MSVVLTAFNGGSLLARSVQSALDQTFRDLELIIVDDGSTDGAAAAVRQHPDPRIVYVRQENLGASGASQAGVRKSRGRVIAFLDQDDLWISNKLERQIQYFDRYPDADLVFTGTRYIGADDRDLALPRRLWDGPVSFELLLEDFVIGNTSAASLRREAIEAAGGFDPSFRYMYDLDLFLRIALRGNGNVVGLPEALTCYRRHAPQMSRDSGGMEEEWDRLLTKMRELAPERTRSRESTARVNMERYFAYLAYERGAYADGCRLMTRSLLRNPAAFLRDRRNWMMSGGCGAAVLLPARALRWLERRAAAASRQS